MNAFIMKPTRVALAGLLFASAALGGCAASSPAASGTAATAQTGTDRPVIGPEYEGKIRVVYQISADEWSEGVGKGLLYLRKLHQSYLDAGIAPERLDIRGVFHGTAAEHLLTNSAWNRYKETSSGNPNDALIRELAQRGVSVELCDSRRQSNGWSKRDIHEDVILVSGAFQRVIDLQLRGYSYIRF